MPYRTTSSDAGFRLHIGSKTWARFILTVSDVNLFRYCQRIVNFDPEISYGAFDLGVAE
jgi:hypothetical protein